MSAYWSTTLTDLLGIFRQALAVLVPIAERARMPWRDGEAYDDWDAVAECLYDSFVVRAVSSAIGGQSNIELPKYDMVYPLYEGAFIEVEGGGVPDDVTAVFVGFAGTSPDFANVKWIAKLPSGRAAEQKIEYAPYDACRFYLVHGKGTERKRTHALTIEI